MRSTSEHNPRAVRLIGFLFSVLVLTGLTLWIVHGGTPASANSPVIGVYTQRYDNTRIGVNSNESILTPSSVNSAGFGKLFTQSVDGQVYAQPLYAPAVNISGQGAHNIVYVATEHDSVYAFDADTFGPPLVVTSLIGNGETTVPAGDVKCNEITNEIGITGTPVIDPATNTLYVLARTKFPTNPATYVQRLHALDLSDLSEHPNFPVTISASVPGTGTASVGGVIGFDPLRENQRAALLLSQNGAGGKQVYIAWASSCDAGPYHGWVLSYDPISGALDGIFNATPNGFQGGIWQSAGGLAEDSNGFIFAVIGNGDYNPPAGDFGNSVVKLVPAVSPSTQITVADFFTPSYLCAQIDQDLDMGSAGPFLFTDQTSNPADILVTGDKLGTIYALNSDNLGGGPTPSPCPLGLPTPTAPPPECSNTATIPECFFDGSPNPGLLYGTMSYWNNELYVAPAKMLPEAFLRTNGIFGTTPVDQVQSGNFSIDGPRGLSTSISANGGTGGIMWILDDAKYTSSSPILYAYDATNLHKLLWASNMNPGRDDPGGITVKFANPTVANGKVYIGTQSTLAVYGLLTQATPTPTPSITPSPTPSGSPTATPTPATTLSFSTASINFGRLAIGDTSAVKTVKVTNTGAMTANFSSISIIGTNAADFQITATTCASSLNPTASCTVKMSFTARASAGTVETAALAFTDNAANSPQTVSLSGSTIVGLAASTMSIAYGTIQTGTTSAAKNLTLKNNHAYSIALQQMMGGNNPSDFAIGGSSTCGANLASGAQCTDSITFTPTATGARSATLSVSDSVDPALVIALSGTGG